MSDRSDNSGTSYASYAGGRRGSEYGGSQYGGSNLGSLYGRGSDIGRGSDLQRTASNLYYIGKGAFAASDRQNRRKKGETIVNTHAVLETLTKCARYVPKAVCEHYFNIRKVEPCKERMLSVLFFIDISGYMMLVDSVSNLAVQRERRRSSYSNAALTQFTKMHAEEIVKNAMGGGEGLNDDMISKNTASNMSMTSEETSNILNDYFTKVLEIIYKYRGDVIKFAGDALLTMWKCKTITKGTTEEVISKAAAEHQEAMKLAVSCAKAIQDQLANYVPPGPVRNVVLKNKISISAGEVLGFHVGGVSDRMEYSIAGKPLDEMAELTKSTSANEIVVTRAVKSHLERVAKFQPLPAVDDPGKTVFLLVDIRRFNPRNAEEAFNLEPAMCDKISKYVPSTVKLAVSDSKANHISEIRRLSILFITFSGIEYTAPTALKFVQEIITAVQHALYKYEGALRQFLVEDKGSVLIAAFGVPPHSNEDYAWRAVMASMQIRHALKQMSVKCSCGITTGNVFCGNIGSVTRCEYGFTGHTVNMAARLMMKARGQILVDEHTHAATSKLFNYQRMKPIAIKGKKGLTTTYLPVSSTTGSSVLYSAPTSTLPEITLTGRKAEKAEILTTLFNAAKKGGCIVFEGGYGIGKTALIDFASARCDEQNFKVIRVQSKSLFSGLKYHMLRAFILATLQSKDLERVADLSLRFGADKLGEHGALPPVARQKIMAMLREMEKNSGGDVEVGNLGLGKPRGLLGGGAPKSAGRRRRRHSVTDMNMAAHMATHVGAATTPPPDLGRAPPQAEESKRHSLGNESPANNHGGAAPAANNDSANHAQEGPAGDGEKEKGAEDGDEAQEVPTPAGLRVKTARGDAGGDGRTSSPRTAGTADGSAGSDSEPEASDESSGRAAGNGPGGPSSPGGMPHIPVLSHSSTTPINAELIKEYKEKKKLSKKERKRLQREKEARLEAARANEGGGAPKSAELTQSKSLSIREVRKVRNTSIMVVPGISVEDEYRRRKSLTGKGRQRAATRTSMGGGSKSPVPIVPAFLNKEVQDEPGTLPAMAHILGYIFDFVWDPENVPRWGPEMKQSIVTEFTKRLLNIMRRQENVAIMLDGFEHCDSDSWRVIEQSFIGKPGVYLAIGCRTVNKLHTTVSKSAIATMKNLSYPVFELEGLTNEHMGSIICEKMQCKSIQEEIKEYIFSKGQGNPMFVQALAEELVQKGIAVLSEGKAVLNNKKIPLPIPNTMSDAIRLQIDALATQVSPNVLMLLKIIAAIGHSFNEGQLEFILPKVQLPIEKVRIGKDIKVLLELDYLEEETEVGGQEKKNGKLMRFSHEAYQEVAYNLLPYHARQQIHAAAAKWYEVQPDRDKYYAVIAFHYERAQQYHTACNSLLKAGQVALNKNASDALMFFSEALHLIEDEDLKVEPLKVAQCYRFNATASNHLGEIENSIEMVSTSLGVLKKKRIDHTPRQFYNIEYARFLLDRWMCCTTGPNLSDMDLDGGPAEDHAKEPQLADELCEPHLIQFDNLIACMQSYAAATSALKVLRLARSKHLRQTYIVACAAVGLSLSNLTNTKAVSQPARRNPPATIKSLLQLAETKCDYLTEPRQISVKYYLSLYYFGVAHFEKCRAHLLELHPLCVGCGDPLHESLSSMLSGICQVINGNLDDAALFFHNLYLDGFEKEDKNLEHFGLLGITYINHLQQNAEEFKQNLENCSNFKGNTTGETTVDLITTGLKAVVLWHGNQTDYALSLAKSLVGMLERVPGPGAELYPCFKLATEVLYDAVETMVKKHGTAKRMRGVALQGLQCLQRFSEQHRIGLPHRYLIEGLHDRFFGDDSHSAALYEQAMEVARALGWEYEAERISAKVHLLQFGYHKAEERKELVQDSESESAESPHDYIDFEDLDLQVDGTGHHSRSMVDIGAGHDRMF